MSEMVERATMAVQMRMVVYGADYEGIARAVIAALREPTEPMLFAVADPRNDTIRDLARDDYRAMIDAALAEPEA